MTKITHIAIVNSAIFYNIGKIFQTKIVIFVKISDFFTFFFAFSKSATI